MITEEERKAILNHLTIVQREMSYLGTLADMIRENDSFIAEALDGCVTEFNKFYTTAFTHPELLPRKLLLR